jgi:hypothetical protein
MPLDELRNKIDDKVEQLNKDVALVNTGRSGVKKVRWIMTEKLPTKGERGEIVARLRNALEDVRRRWPRKFTIEVFR